MTSARLLAMCAARVFLFAPFMTVAAVIPLIMREWALTATAAGAIVSSFTLCYAVSLFASAGPLTILEASGWSSFPRWPEPSWRALLRGEA